MERHETAEPIHLQNLFLAFQQRSTKNQIVSIWFEVETVRSFTIWYTFAWFKTEIESIRLAKRGLKTNIQNYLMTDPLLRARTNWTVHLNGARICLSEKPKNYKLWIYKLNLNKYFLQKELLQKFILGTISNKMPYRVLFQCQNYVLCLAILHAFWLYEWYAIAIFLSTYNQFVWVIIWSIQKY
jgi:hypothetical protein